MRRLKSLQFLITMFFLAFLANPLYSQPPQRNTNQVSIVGWTDNSHYQIRTFDSEKKPVIHSVDIKTGKDVIFQPAPDDRGKLSAALPSGTSLSASDVLSPDKKTAAILIDNDLFTFTIGDHELKKLTNDKDIEVNTRFSPDGKKLAYTKNKDLYVYDLINNKEIRLTSDASAKIYNGYSSWVYMEEILGRSGHYAAFWWSPDGSKLAFLRTDETDVPVFTLNRLDEPDGVHGLIEATPYPKPGDPNPKVKMGIADISTLAITWVKTDTTIDQYIAWPFWTPDSRKLAIQILNRDQNDLKIILADPTTGDYSQIYNENRKTWVEFYEDVYVLKNGSGFILRSYRNDWENLYYHGWDGKLISQLTNLNFRVTSIDRVDEKQKLVYFSATGTESSDSHAFRVGLDGKNILQMTSGHGTHTANISPDGSFYTDSWNSITNAGSIIAYNKSGKKLKEIYTFDQPAFNPSSQSKAEMVKIPTSDGLFVMPAIITYPVNFDSTKKYPVVFTIYGGPNSKNVSNRWQGNTPSWYSQNGIITFAVDHRGSGQFGKKGLDYLYRSLGKWEILDYEDAVKWLRTKAYVDPGKIGITGSSYGGYMTCLALTKGSDYWTHGFAGSSVTDWRLYDNVYTERYMDTPQDNAEGYKDGSTLTYAKDYKGKLYITHGDMDDNVHLQNSIHLISRLEDEGKIFEFMLYPEGRHGWSGAKSVHSKREANNFWLRSFFDGSDMKGGKLYHDGLYAVFNTNKGNIVIMLDYKKAPMTVANFIGLAEGTISNSTYPLGIPFFKGSIWHRVVKGHVIQGGEPSTVKDPANADVNSIGYEIPNEISSLSHNKAGMIGMANDGPNTNTCEYYITLGDRSYLDGNYTLFGEVLDGMDVVNNITKGDTTRNISIIRVGTEADRFIVNNETFKVLVDKQWKKVNSEKENKKSEAEKFISSNYPGLTTLPDGLRFKILVPGNGDIPSPGNTLTVKYEGRLVNGISFISSADEGKPVSGSSATTFTHKAGQEGLVKGLEESLKDMKAGEKRLIVIPPELGYGVKSAYYGKETPGQKRFVISPGETLILETTLVSINQ